VSGGSESRRHAGTHAAKTQEGNSHRRRRVS